MTERQLQFRIGLFVIVAATVAGTMVFFFGQFRSLWERHYEVAARFDAAPGVYSGSPVTMNGVTIGAVRDVVFDNKRGGVTVLIDVREEYRLRSDTQPQLVQSLLGDTTIEFSPGTSPDFLAVGSLLEGESPLDPMEMFHQLDEKLTRTMESLETTSQEWRLVAENINKLVDTKHGNVADVVARTAKALDQFTQTMQTANQAMTNANTVLADPEHRKRLQETLEALPKMVEETRQTILAVRQAVGTVHQNLANLEEATGPLATHSTSIVTKLDRSLGNLESMTAELNQFARLAMKEDGTLKRLASDPDLYQNLDRTATSMAVMLRNLDPVIRNLDTFSDKIARHPELLGVSGALKGSPGLKDAPADDRLRQARRP